MRQGLKRLALSSVPLLALSLPYPAQAVICKSLDENGVVSYTDAPVSECENPVRLRGYSRYSPRPFESSTANGTDGEDAADAEKPYTGLRIVQPANDATIRSNAGKVSVQMTLEPALQAGHKIQLLVDGNPLGEPIAASDMVLSGVERGTHQLSARVVDGKGEVKGNMNTVTFHLRQEALGNTGSDTGDGSYNPDFAPRFTPGFTPDGTYAPSGGGIPRTQGTNPAFAPNYNP